MISRETSVSSGDHFSPQVFVRTVGITALFLALAAVPVLQAQIHGVPASVTSFGPGRGPAPGVPASVTSLGPNGFDGGNQFFVVPNCCNPLFATTPLRGQFRRHHHHRGSVSYYAVPVYAPYYVDPSNGASDESADDEDGGGPTVFDRRGPSSSDGPVSRRYARNTDVEGARGSDSDVRDDRGGAQSSQRLDAARDSSSDNDAATESSSQAPTVLVFKDGHKLDVQNYAILGDVIYDLTPGHPRKIALSDLDLAATQKVNEDLGTNFQLPAHGAGS